MTSTSPFIRITNRDIYDKIVDIEKKIGKHSGTLTWHTWAIGVLVLIIGAIITRIL